MFTGLIEEIGTVELVVPSSENIRLRIRAPKSVPELEIGDSVALDGVCQTIVKKDEQSFEIEAMEETLKKTTMNLLKADSRVNLELPLKFNERLGGHLVLGHVDSVGQVVEVYDHEESKIAGIRIPRRFLRYIVGRGSIAINGVSLTVAETRDDVIKIALIPHTLEQTNLSLLKANDRVNLEFDIIGKYVERLNTASTTTSEEKSFLNEEHLGELGF